MSSTCVKSGLVEGRYVMQKDPEPSRVRGPFPKRSGARRPPGVGEVVQGRVVVLDPPVGEFLTDEVAVTAVLGEQAEDGVGEPVVLPCLPYLGLVDGVAFGRE